MNIASKKTNELERLRQEIKRGTRVLTLSGLTNISAKAFVLCELQQEIDKTFVVITDLNKDIETWENDIAFFAQAQGDTGTRRHGEGKKTGSLTPSFAHSLSLPSFEVDVYSSVSPHAETLEKRALTLWNLTKFQPNFLILSAKSLITKTYSPKKFKTFGAVLKRDEDFPPEELIQKLSAGGYKREEPIANIGEFSMRGGIIDVWSPDSENPIRIEFFGDTVDSIRTFDVNSQLSIEQVNETSIAPMREFSAAPTDFKRWAEIAQKRFTDESFARNLKDRTDFASEGESFSGWEFMFSLVNPLDASIFDFLDNSIFIIDEPTFIEQNLKDFYERLQDSYEEITEHGEIGLMPNELFLEPSELRQQFEQNQRLELRSLGKFADETDEDFQNL